MPPGDEENIRMDVGPLSLISFLLHYHRFIQEEVGIRGWLRNMDLYGVKVPRGIGRLRYMHTLSVVNIARGNAFLKKLKRLTQLRKLGVTGINKKNCKELCSAIVSHGRLQSLLLRAEGDAGTNLEADATMEVLGGLPMLAILRLQDKACKENKVSFRPKGFTSLKALELVGCWFLTSISRDI
uniref:FBD domain-containing protein n=1 Tax=Leersia perrieri TaxID=77586 RepID=A0A0D9XAA9_9ORYZ